MTYVGLDSCEGCHRQKALEGDQDNLCLDCRTIDPFTCATCSFTTIHLDDLNRITRFAFAADEDFIDVCHHCLPTSHAD